MKDLRCLVGLHCEHMDTHPIVVRVYREDRAMSDLTHKVIEHPIYSNAVCCRCGKHYEEVKLAN